MSSLNNLLFFPNLSPCKVDSQACKDMMSRVEDLAPYDSTVKATISLLADGTYHTIIAVSAVCGLFESEGKTRLLVTSLKQAQKSIFKVLVDWKKQRFGND